MSLLLKLVGAIWDFIVGAFVDFFRWAKKPGSKLKLVCGVLAFVTATAAVRAYDAENAARLVTVQCELDKHLLRDDIGARDTKLAEVKATAEADIQARNEQILRAEALRKAAEQRAKAAEESLKAFEVEYDRKPPACTQALANLKTACPTLRDF